jgi:hypothetical protein
LNAERLHYSAGVDADEVFATVTEGTKQRVLLFVTQELEPVPWGTIRGIHNTIHDLYLLHWDEKTKLLYIHSSNKDSSHEEFAKAACGDDAKIMRGERMFRALHGMNRLILMNLGLGHSLSRAIRFTMHVGADIREGLSEAHAQNKFKTNLFGRGYAGGNKSSIGCSVKGRVWSYRIAHDLDQWVQWCHEIGAKLLDATVNVSELLKGALVPETITSRPGTVPITIEWSEDLLDRHEDAVHLEFDGASVPLYEVSLTLTDHRDEGPIRFRVASAAWPGAFAEYEVRFAGERVDYVPITKVEPVVIIGRRKRTVSEYLQAEPPVIRFHDGSFLIYNDLFRAPAGTRQAFDPKRIDAWDWTGVDLSKESQRHEKRADSIQRRVIENVLAMAPDA